MKTDEIIGMIKKQLEGFESAVTIDETGYVIQVGDGIAKIYGMDKVMNGELVEFPDHTFGMVFNLERESVGVIILGADGGIKEGDEVKRTNKILQVPCGDQLLGRVVTPLGEPLDGKGALGATEFRPTEVIAPGVVDRQPVKQPLQTGIKAIDAMIPIGRGQRELLIGDHQTGKSAIAVDTIINQKHEDVICVYVAIGQKQAAVAKTIDKLRRNGAMDYTIVVLATANDPAPLQYIAPYAGCTMAEGFMWKGKDVLVVYDDLSKHAVAYRQLALLLRRPPGREAYPGDIFYLHSRLLERAVKLSDEKGAGSITALPIIETLAGDISAYVPTNVISITDGQIYLETSLFYSGVRPAINTGLSVSRVGGLAQRRAMRQVAGMLRLDLAQYRALSTFAQFGADLDAASRRQLLRGEKLTEAMKQDESKPVPVENEVMLVYAGVGGSLDDVPTEEIKDFEAFLYGYAERKYPELREQIRDGQIDDAARAALDKMIAGAKQAYSDAKH
jgi:F-type H+-transporting ATPase subunit alpha